LICRSAWVMIWSCLWWGKVHLLLGVHHPLMWYGVLQHGRGWVMHISLWGLLGGRWGWQMWSITRFFHPFEVCDLGEMVSIMTILTTKGTREVFLDIFFVLSLAFVVIFPLRVLIPLVLVSPYRLVLLGLVLVSSWSEIIIVSVFSFLSGIVRLMGWISHIVLFKILVFMNGTWLNKVNPSMWLSLW
jgi:hypothetical protein